MADVVVINKVDTGDLDGIATIQQNVQSVNPGATLIEAASPIFVEDPAAIRGKDVLVIKDGPALTHGEMAYGVAHIVDPRPYAVGSILETFKKYPQTGPLLPAMGYGQRQVEELSETINNTPCDFVIVATPIDLRRMIEINRPGTWVRYELQEIGQPTLKDILIKKFG